MGKKKSCQDVKVPRPLDAVETRLYGWVEEAVLTQPSSVEGDSLPEFRRNFPLMEDSGAEGDYVLEAAGPSYRVPFRAGAITRLRMRLPFSDFQRDVMARCGVAVSQLHLNGLFFYIYDVHFPPGGYGYISFRARQGRKLFDSYEDSIQEFKWHYFKVMAAPGKCAFWLDHENKPFSWVYWNPEVKDFAVYNLEPLEMAAFKFLVSLPSGLPKRNKFTCRWILDGFDAEVGKFLDDLLDVKMKRTKLDDLMAKMADPARMGPRPILPTGGPSATATAVAATAAASASATASASTLAGSSSQVPPVPAASEMQKSKKQSSKRDRAKVVNLEDEEGLQEDPAADLQKKRRRKKVKVDEAFEKALGEDSAWEHDVDPLAVAFPKSFNYRKALNAGLTSPPVREALSKMPPEQLLGKSYHLHAKSLACLQEKADTLKDELSEKSLEHQSALDRIAQLEEYNRVLKTQFESSQLSLEAERKRAAAAEGQVGSLAASLKSCQADLSKATEASEYWRSEWQMLGAEVTEMCLETLDICLDQVSHLCPGVDFSAITLKSRWDPKGRRIFVPRESDEGEPSRITEVVPEQLPEPTVQATPSAAGDAAEVGAGCPT
ncbi:hypothetical protein PIB30_074326 [Stylosanthes scabra]|uniref:Transposase (Putative), gypsy type n=1 Tax=Stylosanthes scabra TaxID=79078 RepID=A0ABU6VRH7_9FABA|nr:hypothetical protein [Stylosanthes scabra]